MPPANRRTGRPLPADPSPFCWPWRPPPSASRWETWRPSPANGRPSTGVGRGPGCRRRANRLQVEADVRARHHGPVLRAYDVVRAGMCTRDDISIHERCVVLDILRKALRIGDWVWIPAGRVHLGRVVLGDPQVVPDETRPVLDVRPFLAHRRHDHARHQLVRDRLPSSLTTDGLAIFPYRAVESW